VGKISRRSKNSDSRVQKNRDRALLASKLPEGKRPTPHSTRKEGTNPPGTRLFSKMETRGKKGGGDRENQAGPSNAEKDSKVL